MKRFFKGKKGFTLIELLIVIAVLAALAAVVVPAVSTFLNNSKKAAANNEVAAVKTAATAYLADVGSYPADSDALFPAVGTKYMSAAAEATYPFDANGQITAVTVEGKWAQFTFNTTSQSWE